MQLRNQCPIPIGLLDLLFTSELTLEVMRGTDTHIPTRDLVARVVRFSRDVAYIKGLIAAALPTNYDSDTLDGVAAMVEGALKKGFDETKSASQTAIALKEAKRSGIEAVADDNGKVFVGIPQEQGGIIYHPLRSTLSKGYVRLLVLESTGKPLKQEPLTELLDTFEANAIYRRPRASINLRWARDGDRFVLDPGWPGPEKIVVNRLGWTVERADHVRFRRPSGFGAMPRPGSGKGLRKFAALLGLEGRNAILFTVFLLNCMRPTGPYMFLLAEGVQGSGKSILSTAIRSIVDPHAIPKGRLPKNEHELMIAASENFLLLFDNTSRMNWDLSDALCALATGSGYVTRKLYTDNELQSFTASRPVILNGIGQFANRPDLLERSVQLRLPKMPTDRRMTEKQLEAALADVLPDVLAELLDAASAALARIEEVPAPKEVRMADAAHFAVAAEEALGFEPGTVLRALVEDQQETMIERALGDPLVLAVVALLHRRRLDGKGDGFRGTVGQLLKLVLTEHRNENDRRDERWVPSTPSHLSNQLKRLVPAFTTLGVTITYAPRQARGQEITIALEPGGLAAEMDDDEVRRNQAMIDKITHGRV